MLSAFNKTIVDTILVVENNQNMQELYRRILEPHVVKLLCESRITDAIEVVQQVQPGVILLDMDLADGSGIDFCQQLRKLEQGRQPVVIAVTSSDAETILMPLIEAGCDDYLQKPVSKTGLLTRVTIAASRWRSRKTRSSMEQTLEANAERVQAALSAARDCIWDWHPKTNEIYFSKEWEHLLGFVDRELDRTPEEWFSRIHPADRNRFNSSLSDLLRQKSEVLHVEHRILDRDGGYRWVLARGAPLFEDDKIKRITGTLTDISTHTTFDALTGLANRSLFRNRVAHACERYSRNPDERFAVLFVDLDGFKAVNDTLGHQIGDVLLQEVANRIEGAVRTIDTVARLGGDEFGVLMEQVPDPARAVQLAQSIVDELKRPVDAGGRNARVSCCVGIAMAARSHVSVESYLSNADLAMYMAKKAGVGSVKLFVEEMRTEVSQKFDLRNELANAIDSNELFLEFQPVVSLQNEQCVGAEALMRWHLRSPEHPEGYAIPPDTFIALAEETGLISQLDRWVVSAAAAAASELIQTTKRNDLWVSINISAPRLADPAFLDDLHDATQTNSIEPHNLRIELTESTLMNFSNEASVFLEELQRAGYRIAIDDFGTGYSSMSYLTKFAFETLKIDKTFIHDVDSSQDALRVVETIVALGRNLNKYVVAEGLESRHQKIILQSLGCHAGQGFYFSKPLSAEDIADFVRHPVPSGN